MLPPNLPAHPCYLNGAYTSLDRGFIFGEGCMRCCRCTRRRRFELFSLHQHMARLEQIVGRTAPGQPIAREAWRKIATDLIAARAIAVDLKGINASQLQDHLHDYLIYLQVTRGVALRDHVMPQNITPTVFAMCTVMNPPSLDVRAKGVACVSQTIFAGKKPTSSPPACSAR